MQANDKVIRIAEIVGNSVTGGVPSQVVNLVRHLDHDRFVCDFFTYGPSRYDEEIRLMGGEVYYVPSMKNPLKAIPALTKLLRGGRYDIAHSHMTALSVVPLLAAKRAHIGVRICHGHSTTHPSERTAWIKNILKHFAGLYATHLAACGRWAATWLYGDKKGAKATIIRNAVDLTRFSPSVEPDPQLVAQTTGCKVIGGVGRMVYQKNVPFLVDAFAYLTTLVKDVKLVLVGDGAEREEVVRRIEAYGLQDKVLLLPEVAQVERYLKVFDLLALPSFYEGLPLVVMEAQAMGVKALVSDQVTTEADMGGVTYLPIDSAKEWGAKMAAMLAEPAIPSCASVMRERGFDMDEEGKRLERFYLSCLGKGEDA